MMMTSRKVFTTRKMMLTVLRLQEYLKKVVKKQNIIQSALADLAEDVRKIKNGIDKKNTELIKADEDSQSLFTSVSLPINSEVKLENLEEYLVSTEAMSTAIKEILSSGGKDAYEIIYRATKKLITNTFASTYNYIIRQKKFLFIKNKRIA